MQAGRWRDYQPVMLATSHFLLWVSVALLAIALVSLGRQVRSLRLAGGTAGASSGGADLLPIISAPTVAGDTITIGGASRDGRALLLLFVNVDCTASAQALRVAVMLCDPGRLRLVVFGEGDAAAYGALLDPYPIRPADIVLQAGIGAEIAAGPWPAAVLMTGDGAVLGRGAVHRREQFEALLASLAPGDAKRVAERV